MQIFHICRLAHKEGYAVSCSSLPPPLAAGAVDAAAGGGGGGGDDVIITTCTITFACLAMRTCRC